MTDQNRFTDINPSTGSKSSEERAMQKRYDDVNQRIPSYQIQYHQDPDKQSTHRGWMWGFFGLVAVLLIIGAAVWMRHVSNSLAQLNHQVQKNGRVLSHLNIVLTTIRAQLHQISQQLAQISTQLTTFFGKMMQAINSAKQ